MTTTQMVIGSEAIFPNITTRGLFLNLDGTNPSSYPGSGTTWFDLSGNGLNATLVGSPTYSNADTSVGLGSFNFDGISQYAVTPTINAYMSAGTPFTLEMWIKNTSTAGAALSLRTTASIYNTLFEFGNVGPFYTARWYMLTGSAPGYRYSNIGSILPPTNEWNQYTMVYYGSAGSQTTLGYQGPVPTTTLGTPNVGVPSNSGGNSGINAGATLNIARNVAGGTQNSSSGMTGATNYFAGRVGILRAYNRLLTQTEIQQNYNATRAYYGL